MHILQFFKNPAAFFISGLGGYLASQTLKKLQIHIGEHHGGVYLAAFQFGKLLQGKLRGAAGSRTAGKRDQNLVSVETGISASQICGL